MFFFIDAINPHAAQIPSATPQTTAARDCATSTSGVTAVLASLAVIAFLTNIHAGFRI
jgi:hypothetical protein